jgi:hypothetical protein
MSHDPECESRTRFDLNAGVLYCASCGGNYEPAAPMLYARMREAAQVLVEVSELYEAFDPHKTPWCAEELLNEATHVEAEEV